MPLRTSDVSCLICPFYTVGKWPGLSPYKRQHLISFLLHQLPTVRLDIQAEQGLGIRWTHIEPPVAEVQGDTICVINRLRFLAKVLHQSLHFTLNIAHF